MTSLRLLAGLLVFAFAVPAAFAQAPDAAPTTHAVLVGGQPGQEPYARWYADWLGRFEKYLTGKAGVPKANITALSGDAATSKAVLAAIADAAKSARPGDQFILFLVGHGQISQAPLLTLKGPDLSAGELAATLRQVQAKQQIVLNFSASSGDFLKALAAPGRVNITSTSPTEADEAVLAEFFLRGLESGRADTNNDQAVSMLEAFNWAAQQTALWIARWEQTNAAEELPEFTIWKASGKETVEIFEKLYGAGGTRRLDPASDRAAADAVVEIQPPNGEITEAWMSRRIIDEHALLEDSGKPVGVSVLGEKGLTPIVGQNPDDPGNLASRTVLGRPAAP